MAEILRRWKGAPLPIKFRSKPGFPPAIRPFCEIRDVRLYFRMPMKTSHSIRLSSQVGSRSCGLTPNWVTPLLWLGGYYWRYDAFMLHNAICGVGGRVAKRYSSHPPIDLKHYQRSNATSMEVQ